MPESKLYELSSITLKSPSNSPHSGAKIMQKLLKMVKSGQTSGQTGQKWSNSESTGPNYPKGKRRGPEGSTYLAPCSRVVMGLEAGGPRYI